MGPRRDIAASAGTAEIDAPAAAMVMAGAAVCQPRETRDGQDRGIVIDEATYTVRTAGTPKKFLRLT